MLEQMKTALSAATTVRAVDDVARIMWKAAGSGALNEAEAQALAEAVQARRMELRPQPLRGRAQPLRRTVVARPPVQRSPDRARSLERRRRLASAGPLPPNLACHFTVAELAALKIIGDEMRRIGCCTRSIGEIAARAGVGRTSVQNAVRRAAELGLLTITERRLTGWRNDTNLLRLADPAWRAWLRIGGRAGGRVQESRQHGQHVDSGSEPTLPWMTAVRRGKGTPPAETRSGARPASNPLSGKPPHTH